LYAPSSRGDFDHSLTFLQTNILVDGDGHARIAGLGTALIPSTVPAADVDQSFHGTAPELIDPRRRGFTDAGVTMASDVFAFAVLAWEVREKLVASVDKRLNGKGS